MPRITATFSNPASAGAYASGDHIANSATGSAVTPMTFSLYPGDYQDTKGCIISAACVVTPASGSLVITALDFDLLLFRPVTSIPFAAGSYPADNAAMDITAAAFRQLIGVFSFSSGNWRNPAGALTAGATGWQRTVSAMAPLMEFDTADTRTLIGVVQAKGAWTPGAVVNQFDFVLDVSNP